MGNFLTVSQTSQTPVNSSLRGRWGEIDGLRICARPTLVICSVHESQHGTRGCDGPREGGGGAEERRGEARRTGSRASSAAASAAVGRLRVWVRM